MDAFADLFVGIESLDVERELASIYFGQLGAGADFQANWGGGQMANVEPRADGYLAGGQDAVHSFQRSVFH